MAAPKQKLPFLVALFVPGAPLGYRPSKTLAMPCIHVCLHRLGPSVLAMGVAFFDLRLCYDFACFGSGDRLPYRLHTMRSRHRIEEHRSGERAFKVVVDTLLPARRWPFNGNEGAAVDPILIHPTETKRGSGVHQARSTPRHGIGKVVHHVRMNAAGGPRTSYWSQRPI